MKIYRDKVGAVNPEHGRDSRQNTDDDNEHRQQRHAAAVEFSDDDRNTDTTEHARQVQAVAAGRNIIEEPIAFRPQISKPNPVTGPGSTPPILQKTGSVLIRPWNAERPLEGEALPTLLLSNSKRWSQRRGRYTHFQVSRRVRGRLVRSVPGFGGR